MLVGDQVWRREIHSTPRAAAITSTVASRETLFAAAPPSLSADPTMAPSATASLATGYYLAQHERDFILLDAGERVGDSWRNRWDSLKLFTPAASNALPGMSFPAPDAHLPHKDE